VLAEQSVRRSDILPPGETVVLLVLPPGLPVNFQEVVVAAAAAKNTVL
jgi:hypothetical protein